MNWTKDQEANDLIFFCGKALTRTMYYQLDSTKVKEYIVKEEIVKAASRLISKKAYTKRIAGIW